MGNICGMREHPNSTHGARATLKDKLMDDVRKTPKFYQEAEPILDENNTTIPEWLIKDLYFVDIIP